MGEGLATPTPYRPLPTPGVTVTRNCKGGGEFKGMGGVGALHCGRHRVPGNPDDGAAYGLSRPETSNAAFGRCTGDTPAGQETNILHYQRATWPADGSMAQHWLSGAPPGRGFRVLATPPPPPRPLT